MYVYLKDAKQHPIRQDLNSHVISVRSLFMPLLILVDDLNYRYIYIPFSNSSVYFDLAECVDWTAFI